MRENCIILFEWDVWPLSQHVLKCVSLSMTGVKMRCIALHKHLEFSGITPYETPRSKPLTMVISSLPPSPCLPAASSSLPCVSACFRARQEAQIWGLKLDQIFSRYRFLRVPGFSTSSTQLLSIARSLRPLLSSLQSQTKLCVPLTNTHTHTHTRTDSHARMHMGNHKLTQSGGEVQLI